MKINPYVGGKGDILPPRKNSTSSEKEVKRNATTREIRKMKNTLRGEGLLFL